LKVASAFEPGNGMLDQLRELAEAEPFVPITIRLQTGTKLRVAKRQYIEFTHYGSPKVWSATTGKHSLDEPGEPKRRRILNVDAIAEIIL
jgi:hypothetical protein